MGLKRQDPVDAALIKPWTILVKRYFNHNILFKSFCLFLKVSTKPNIKASFKRWLVVWPRGWALPMDIFGCQIFGLAEGPFGWYLGGRTQIFLTLIILYYIPRLLTIFLFYLTLETPRNTQRYTSLLLHKSLNVVVVSWPFHSKAS